MDSAKKQKCKGDFRNDSSSFRGLICFCLFAFMQQGWPAGTQQILIPSTWQQMPGISIHNPGQAGVLTDSPVGAPLSESQQASGWRWVRHRLKYVWGFATDGSHVTLSRLGVVTVTSLMGSRSLGSAVTPSPSTTAQGLVTPDPRWGKGRRLVMLRAEPGMASVHHPLLPFVFPHSCGLAEY